MSKFSEQHDLRWYAVDLHIHTPASADYLRPIPGPYPYLEILRTARRRGLSAVGITDHNTVAGVAAMRREIEVLELLEEKGRLTVDEANALKEYRQLLGEILVLPGFEFTATLGFHVLGLFPPDTPIRKLEFLLLQLKIPVEKLDLGSTEVGATVDVLQAYQLIASQGGLVIAAHANSSHGVAMARYGYGGQTRIAYTQDPNLHALEVTDLESRSRHATARFFDGSRKDYPRRMHCIQGSDAHVPERLPEDRPGTYGIGERATELLLPELSFDAIKELFMSDHFERHRPYRPVHPFVQRLEMARQAGQMAQVAFYEGPIGSRTVLQILRDVAAMANGAGGVVYVGAGPRPGTKIKGVEDPEKVKATLMAAIEEGIAPRPKVSIQVAEAEGKLILLLHVAPGPDLPYVIPPSQVYVRTSGITRVATRDELVGLLEKRSAGSPRSDLSLSIDIPCTGVEIVSTEERDGMQYYSMCDLRTGKIVQNVTRFSARSLWRYAILLHEEAKGALRDVFWQGDMGVWHMQPGRTPRYDLVLRQPDGRLRVFYGVTLQGVPESWKPVIEAFHAAKGGGEAQTEA